MGYNPNSDRFPPAAPTTGTRPPTQMSDQEALAEFLSRQASAKATPDVMQDVVAAGKEQTAADKARSKVTSRSSAPLTGTKSEIVDRLFGELDRDRSSLDAYEAGSTSPLFRDDEKGIMWRVTGWDAKDWEVDPEGTRLFKIYLNSLDNFRTYTGRLEDLSESAGSAFDYLGAEKARIAETERQYADYIGRIGDIASLEAIEGDKFKSLSDFFDQDQKRTIERNRAINDGSLSRASTSLRIAGPIKPNTNFTNFANAIKGTLPNQPPGMTQMDPSVLQPRGGGGGAEQIYNLRDTMPEGVVPLGPVGPGGQTPNLGPMDPANLHRQPSGSSGPWSIIGSEPPASPGSIFTPQNIIRDHPLTKLLESLGPVANQVANQAVSPFQDVPWTRPITENVSTISNLLKRLR